MTADAPPRIAAIQIRLVRSRGPPSGNDCFQSVGRSADSARRNGTAPLSQNGHVSSTNLATRTIHDSRGGIVCYFEAWVRGVEHGGSPADLDSYRQEGIQSAQSRNDGRRAPKSAPTPRGKRPRPVS